MFGQDGKRDKSISEVIDGSCGNIDEFFTLLEEHLRKVNLAEAAEIVFCADNGAGIWPRCAALAEKLKMKDPKFILDYTHAKQNMGEVAALLAATLKLKDKPAEKLREEIMDMLWQGDILGVKKLVADRLSVKVKGARAALKRANRKLSVTPFIGMEGCPSAAARWKAPSGASSTSASRAPAPSGKKRMRRQCSSYAHLF